MRTNRRGFIAALAAPLASELIAAPEDLSLAKLERGNYIFAVKVGSVTHRQLQTNPLVLSSLRDSGVFVRVILTDDPDDLKIFKVQNAEQP